MSFTQQNRIHIGKWTAPAPQVSPLSNDNQPPRQCTGCNFHCDLGYKLDNGEYYLFPTIGKIQISEYIDERGHLQYTGKPYAECWNKQGDIKQQKLSIVRQAAAIAKLCDHYKTR